MPTYVLLTKLSPDLAQQVEKRRELGRAWLDQVKKSCPEVKFISHYLKTTGIKDFQRVFAAVQPFTGCFQGFIFAHVGHGIH